MQPTVKLAVLCDYAITGQDGKLSAIGMWSNINFPSLPNPWPRFFVVIVLVLDRGTHDVKLGVVDPIGQQILPDPVGDPITVDVPGSETNLVIEFNNLLFNRPGIHQVQLFLNQRLLHAIPMNIQAVSSEGFTPIQAS